MDRSQKLKAREDERWRDLSAFTAGPGGAWINTIPDAPVFTPTAEEWADPIAYIRAVQASCVHAGLARIVPPVLPVVPAPFVLAQQGGWRYTVRQQHIGGGAWRTFDDAQRLIYESHRTFTLGEHEKKANEYARKVFGSAAHMPHRMVEAEYWRQRSDPSAQPSCPTSSVLYGNDVDGSAFSDRRDDAAAAGGWNLRTLPAAPGSLLGLLQGTVVPGVTAPSLYIGMLGATFCWHVEDHWLYSINYAHYGAPKVWYTVPASDAEAFEVAVGSSVYGPAVEAARRAGEDEAAITRRVQSSLLLKSTMVSPGVLMQKGVRVFRAVQQPGEYIVTLPRSYHGGFSCGFNLGEAVNFTTPDWLAFGLQCAARLRRLGVDHILGTEQLLVAAAEAVMPAGLPTTATGIAAVEAEAAAALDSGAETDAAAAAQHPPPDSPAAAAGAAAAAAAASSTAADLTASARLTLRCFLRLMRWHNTARRSLISRGAGVGWFGTDQAHRSLPCAECREPAFLEVVVDRSSGACMCLRCAGKRAGEGGRSSLAVLVRRSLPALEARARLLEPLVLGAPGQPQPSPGEETPLGPGGLSESSLYGSDPMADADLGAPFDWADTRWPEPDGGEEGGADGAAAAVLPGPPPATQAHVPDTAAGSSRAVRGPEEAGDDEGGEGTPPQPQRSSVRTVRRRLPADDAGQAAAARRSAAARALLVGAFEPLGTPQNTGAAVGSSGAPGFWGVQSGELCLRCSQH